MYFSMLTDLNNCHMHRLFCQQGLSKLHSPALQYQPQYAHCCCNGNCCKRSVAYFIHTRMYHSQAIKGDYLSIHSLPIPTLWTHECCKGTGMRMTS